MEGGVGGGMDGGVEGGIEGGIEGGVEGGVEGSVDTGTTRCRIAQAMRPPSKPWTIKARPSISLAVAPVVTSTMPLALPLESEV